MTPPNLAKPTGVLYETHITDVLAQLDELFSVRPFIFKKYTEMVGDNLYEITKLACEWHDRGKLFSSWQNACQLDFEIYKKLSDDQKKSFKAINLQSSQNKYRHELISLLALDKYVENADWRVKVAIAAHHGKLSQRYEKRWVDNKEFIPYWNDFKNFDGDSLYKSTKEEILNRYKYCSSRALLKYCDERASRIEDNQSVISAKKFKLKYVFPDGWKKRGVQKKIDELKDEDIAVLRAPTGSGKTHAAFLWAQYQVDNDKADRLVIAMPTRFTANGILNSVHDIISSGVYHSSAKFNRQQEHQDMIAAKSLELACNIVTVDQLCLCLTSTSEQQQSVFFNLANSCVVFDEADFYDDFIQYNILELLKALRVLKVPVLIMSATVPNSHLNFYSLTGTKILKIFSDTSRDHQQKFYIQNVGNVSELTDIAPLLETTLLGTPTIVYANTVKRAQSYYSFFKEQGVECVLYHSQYKESDKQAIEEKLLIMLGEQAWQDDNAHGVVVMSQIGEMSINISADIMFTDLCPIDRLMQRFGRLSRFNNDGLGKAYIMIPFANDKIFPYPYANNHEPIEPFSRTKELLENKKYSFGDLLNVLERVYTSIPELSAKIKENIKSYQQMIENNWLILPCQLVVDDTDIEQELSEWKCRDMQPTCILFCDDLSGNGLKFNSYYQFQEYCLEHTITVAIYIRDKLRQLGLCCKFEYTIGKEKFTGVRVFESYDDEYGLRTLIKKKGEGVIL